MSLNLRSPQEDNTTDDVLVMSENGDIAKTSKDGIVTAGSGLRKESSAVILGADPTDVGGDGALTEDTILVRGDNPAVAGTSILMSDDFANTGNPVITNVQTVVNDGEDSYSSTINSQISDQDGTITPEVNAVVTNPAGSKGLMITTSLNGIVVSDGLDGKGLVGEAYYGGIVDDEAYAQQKFVNDAVTTGVAGKISQNGDSFGTSMIIGTNDNFDVQFERNNVLKAAITDTSISLQEGVNLTNRADAARFSMTVGNSSASAGVTRTTADSVAAFRITNSNDTSTGDILQLRSTISGSTSVRAGARKDGRVYGTNGTAADDFTTKGQLDLKADSSNVVDKSTNQTGIAGNKSWTGVQTWETGSFHTFNRTLSATTGISGSLVFGITSTGSPNTSSFGSRFPFQVQGTTIAGLGWRLDGALNSGALVFQTYSAGVENTWLTIDKDGKATFTGSVEVPTPTTSVQAANKGYVDAVDALKAPLSSPALTGTPTSPTAAAGTNTTQVATTAFVQGEINLATGWGQYQDTVYTSGSPLSLVADIDTNLPNNAGSVIETQKPADVTTFYNGTTITGREGDGIMITIDMKALPTEAGTTYLEVWFDVGGSVGELYRRIITFPKGNGVLRPINFTIAGYTLDTWETNGATVKVRANGTCDIYDIRYIITRTHKAN